MEEQINSNMAVEKIQSQTLTKLKETKQQVIARIFSKNASRGPDKLKRLLNSKGRFI
jgi:hypothetical protein